MGAGQSPSTREDERLRESAFRAMSEAQLSAWLQANPVFEDFVVSDRATRAELLAYRTKYAHVRSPTLAGLSGDDATADEGLRVPGRADCGAWPGWCRRPRE